MKEPQKTRHQPTRRGMLAAALYIRPEAQQKWPPIK
jgi:hypothetical protein